MSKSHLLAACTIGSAAFLLAYDCQAQGNIDRGKTPAQAFTDTCAACHRSPRALKHTSAAFLRQHYSASSAEASAMATYLAGFPSEVHQSKRPPASGAETRAEAAKQRPRQQPADSSQPSGERLTDVTEVSPAPPVADRSLASSPPPGRVLEAFEE